MTFLPNFKSKFPKLKAISVQCGLKYIFVDDMKPFGSSLDFANFFGNDITYLDADLFEFNQNLKYVSFGENPLKFIDPEFVKNLKSLTSIQYVGLGGTSACMNHVFDSTVDKIQDFKWKDEICRNIDQVEVKNSLRGLAEVKGILPIYKLNEKIDNEKSHQLKNLQEENAELKKTISSEREKFEIFEQKIMNRMDLMEHEISIANEANGENISKLIERIENLTSASEKCQENEKLMNRNFTMLKELIDNIR